MRAVQAGSLAEWKHAADQARKGIIALQGTVAGAAPPSSQHELDPADRPGTTIPWAMPGHQKEAMLDPSTAKWLKELRTAELRMPRYHFLQEACLPCLYTVLMSFATQSDVLALQQAQQQLSSADWRVPCLLQDSIVAVDVQQLALAGDEDCDDYFWLADVEAGEHYRLRQLSNVQCRAGGDVEVLVAGPGQPGQAVAVPVSALADKQLQHIRHVEYLVCELCKLQLRTHHATWGLVDVILACWRKHVGQQLTAALEDPEPGSVTHVRLSQAMLASLPAGSLRQELVNMHRDTTAASATPSSSEQATAAAAAAAAAWDSYTSAIRSHQQPEHLDPQQLGWATGASIADVIAADTPPAAVTAARSPRSSQGYQLSALKAALQSVDLPAR